MLLLLLLLLKNIDNCDIYQSAMLLSEVQFAFVFRVHFGPSTAGVLFHIVLPSPTSFAFSTFHGPKGAAALQPTMLATQANL
jgi:hypothetical protein